MSILTTIGITAAADAIRRMWGRLVRRGRVADVDSRFRPHLDYAREHLKKHGHEYDEGRGVRLFLEPGRRINQGGDAEWVFTFRGEQCLGVIVFNRPFEVYLGSDGKGAFSVHTARHEGGHATAHPDATHFPEGRAYFKGWSDTGYRPASGAPDMPLIAHIDYADGTGALCSITQGERQMLIASACNGGEAWV